jgi:hypothetical protein
MANKRIMTLHLSEEQMTALEEMSARECSSKAEIVRRALKLYQLVEERSQKGHKFFIENGPQDGMCEVMVF